MEISASSEFVCHREGATTVCDYGQNSGVLIACGNNRGAINIWALGCTTTPLRSFRFEKEISELKVTSVHFDTTEEFLIGTAANAIKIWDLRNGKLVRSFSSPFRLTSSFFHPLPSAEIFAVTDDQATLQIWDMRGRKIIHDLPQAGYGLGFSPDGEVVVTAVDSGLKFFHPVSGFLLQSLDLPGLSIGNRPLAIAFHPRKRQCTVCSAEGQIRIIDLSTFGIVRSLEVSLSTPSRASIAYDRSGKVLYVGSGRQLLSVQLADAEPTITDHSALLPPSEMSILRFSSTPKVSFVVLSRSRTLQILPFKPHSSKSAKPSRAAAELNPLSQTSSAAPGPSQPDEQFPEIPMVSISTRLSGPSRSSGDSTSIAIPERTLQRGVTSVTERTRLSASSVPSPSLPQVEEASVKNPPIPTEVVRSAALQDEESPSDYLRDHPEIIGMLATRLRIIRMVKSLWAKGMKTPALEQLAKANCAGAVIDFLRAVDILEKPTDSNPEPPSLTHVTRVFGVEHSLILMPVLRQMISDPNDAISCSAISAMTTLIKAFASMITVGLRSSQAGNRSGSSAASFRSANSELVMLKKIVAQDSTFSRRSMKIKRARRDLVSALKTIQ